MANLKAPFPYFGGKSKVAPLVWQRLADVRNYVEPFCGSAAMLLNRPTEPKVETLNDANAYLANFWRAVQADPAAVAEHADWPVNEVDLHARHRWLVFSEEALAGLQRVRQLPEYYDAKIAGWWCWGACCWIGSGWCPEQIEGVGGRNNCPEQLPNMQSQGVHRKISDQLPHITEGRGVNKSPKKLPHMDAGARGVVHSGPQEKRPRISGWSETGVNRQPSDTHRPQLADRYARGRGVHSNDEAGNCDQRREWLVDWMQQLADRLRPVRVCCGHWKRICDSPSTTTRLGLTGAFLDPPYRVSIDGQANRNGNLYSNDKQQDVNALCDEVQEWCLKHGDDPEMRIALCGLEGEYPQLDHWECVEWKANGGYGNQGGEVNENASRERIWFSPHCVTAFEEQPYLF